MNFKSKAVILPPSPQLFCGIIDNQNCIYLKFEFYIVLKLTSNHNNLEHISTKYFPEGFPDGPVVQNRPCNAGDISSILGQEDAGGATKSAHHSY